MKTVIKISNCHSECSANEMKNLLLKKMRFFAIAQNDTNSIK